MTLFTILAITVMATATQNPELCEDVENKIESGMRILESDLSQSAAIEAAERLSDLIARGDFTNESGFSAGNQEKIIHGHILLRQAMAAREEFGSDSVETEESTKSLCNWLRTDGFWYD